MNLSFDRSIKDLLNLKDSTVSNLQRLGISVLRDMVFHIPLYYVQKQLDPDFEHLKQDDVIITTIQINSVPSSQDRVKKFMGVNKFGQSIELIFFSQVPKFIWAYLKLGKTVTVQGKVSLFSHQVQLAHPEVVFNLNLIKMIEPIYPLTQGVGNSQLHGYILCCLNHLEEISNWHELEKQLALPTIRESLINIHDPSDLQDIERYLKRMALEEVLINQYLMNQIRYKNKLPREGSNATGLCYERQVISNLGFSPTPEQEKALAEITKDQQASMRMIRMLQGDVGCGKTLVALFSMLKLIQEGKQCCIMAPTEVLSFQHLKFFQKALNNTGITVGLLTSSIKGEGRKQLLSQLSDGMINVLIGTHALFQEQIVFKNLAYVIIDEQQRFGVQQRLDLLYKGKTADLLLMSATPIPRTMSMIMYGDMDVSYIKAKPKNNLQIITNIMSTNKMLELVASLNSIFTRSEKVYWICPLIEESQHKAYSNVTLRYEALRQVYGQRVGLLHGGMSQAQKNQTMLDYRDGTLDLLVATTVIEVGVDVPSATLIVIEDAPAFGLSQLHQLRGRVGRNDLQSYCILLYQAKLINEIGKKRLSILKNNNDGFELAEQDLYLRGSGDIVGSRQSGEIGFVFTNFQRDASLIAIARDFIINNPQHTPSANAVKLFDKEHIANNWLMA